MHVHITLPAGVRAQDVTIVLGPPPAPVPAPMHVASASSACSDEAIETVRALSLPGGRRSVTGGHFPATDTEHEGHVFVQEDSAAAASAAAQGHTLSAAASHGTLQAVPSSLLAPVRTPSAPSKPAGTVTVMALHGARERTFYAFTKSQVGGKLHDTGIAFSLQPQALVCDAEEDKRETKLIAKFMPPVTKDARDVLGSSMASVQLARHQWEAQLLLLMSARPSFMPRVVEYFTVTWSSSATYTAKGTRQVIVFMEKADGALSELFVARAGGVARIAAMTPRERLQLCIRMASAMAEFHDLRDGEHFPCGIVHGDVHLGQFLFDTCYDVITRVYICDFGASFPVGIVKHEPMSKADDLRTAPELLTGSYVQPQQAADVYSLGLCLFSIMAGVDLGAAAREAATKYGAAGGTPSPAQFCSYVCDHPTLKLPANVGIRHCVSSCLKEASLRPTCMELCVQLALCAASFELPSIDDAGGVLPSAAQLPPVRMHMDTYPGDVHNLKCAQRWARVAVALQREQQCSWGDVDDDDDDDDTVVAGTPAVRRVTLCARDAFSRAVACSPACAEAWLGLAYEFIVAAHRRDSESSQPPFAPILSHVHGYEYEQTSKYIDLLGCVVHALRARPKWVWLHGFIHTIATHIYRLRDVTGILLMPLAERTITYELAGGHSYRAQMPVAHVWPEDKAKWDRPDPASDASFQMHIPTVLTADAISSTTDRRKLAGDIRSPSRGLAVGGGSLATSFVLSLDDAHMRWELRHPDARVITPSFISSDLTQYFTCMPLHCSLLLRGLPGASEEHVVHSPFSLLQAVIAKSSAASTAAVDACGQALEQAQVWFAMHEQLHALQPAAVSAHPLQLQFCVPACGTVCATASQCAAVGHQLLCTGSNLISALRSSGCQMVVEVAVARHTMEPHDPIRVRRQGGGSPARAAPSPRNSEDEAQTDLDLQLAIAMSRAAAAPPESAQLLRDVSFDSQLALAIEASKHDQ